MSFPKYLVDRTAFLEGAIKINPAYAIAGIIQKLEKAGATIVGIGCNTSYAPEIFNVLLEELNKMNSQVKLLNMPLETCRYISDNYPQVSRVGLMTSNGTYKSKTYKSMLEAFGFEVVVPGYDFQNEMIHKMIYDPQFGIKTSSDTIETDVILLMNKALSFFKEKKAEAVILGCTEFSLVLNEHRVEDMLIVDSTESLARALIREASKKVVPARSFNNEVRLREMGTEKNIY